MRKILLLAAAAALLAAGCSSTTSSPPAPPAPSASPAAPTSAQDVTAQRVVDRLSGLYPLPNPRDNTRSCTDAGCQQLITTDAVSVYEWADAAAAKRWAAGLGKNAEQVGRFVLSWVGSEQAFTSQEARAEMIAATKKIAG